MAGGESFLVEQHRQDSLLAGTDVLTAYVKGTKPREINVAFEEVTKTLHFDCSIAPVGILATVLPAITPAPTFVLDNAPANIGQLLSSFDVVITTNNKNQIILV
jgi:hypothetical protein